MEPFQLATQSFRSQLSFLSQAKDQCSVCPFTFLRGELQDIDNKANNNVVHGYRL